jgi:hypothetical protein
MLLKNIMETKEEKKEKEVIMMMKINNRLQL